MSVSSGAVKQLFLAASEKSTIAERSAFLEESCGGDATLRRRVEELLQAHDQADPLLDHPVILQAEGEISPATDDSLSFLESSQKPGSLGRLGHYEVLEVIGRGGMGIVLKAFDEKLQRVIAIKALAPLLATTGSARQRFVREARAAAAVTHDNVIAIHAVEDDGAVPFLVMQCIHGKTLQEKLDQKGPLELAEILRIGLQIADGLAAAHRHGLVHRDVKPANILLENSVERVKITDFGLARAVDDASLTQSGLIAGTPMYMSPEQAEGERVDHRSDLFSLGSVMYAMCCGHPPFRATSTPAVLKRVANDAPRPLHEINASIPDWLEAIIDVLMAKSPADRIQTAAEVAKLLGDHLAHLQGRGQLPLLVQPRPTRHSKAGGKFTPKKVAIGACAVFVVGTLVGLAMWRPWLANSPIDPDNSIGEPLPQPREIVAKLPKKKWAKVGTSVSASSLIDSLELARLPAAADALDPKNIPLALRKAAFGSDAKNVPPEVVAIVGEDLHKGQANQQCQMYTIAFSPDGKVLAMGGFDRVVRLWDMSTGKLKQALTWEDRLGQPYIYSLAYSPDGKLLAAADSQGGIHLWQAISGKDLGTLVVPGQRMNQVAFSPDSQLLAVARVKGDVQIWDVAKRSVRRTIVNGNEEIWCLAFSPDGTTLATSAAGVVRFWEVSSGNMSGSQLVDGSNVRWVGYHPLGNVLATAGSTAHGFILSIQLWDIANASRFRDLEGHTSTVLTGAWRADGKMLATAGETDGTVRVWDLSDGPARSQAFKLVPPNLQWLHAISLSPEGRYLAVAHPAGIALIVRLAKQGEVFSVPKS